MDLGLIICLRPLIDPNRLCDLEKIEQKGYLLMYEYYIPIFASYKYLGITLIGIEIRLRTSITIIYFKHLD